MGKDFGKEKIINIIMEIGKKVNHTDSEFKFGITAINIKVNLYVV